MSSNNVTLFSNGIGHFRRYYEVDKNLEISIPFKKAHVGDVASSLQVFGNVKLHAPPSFTPVNSGEPVLQINESNALDSLLRNLSGAKIHINSSMYEGDYTLLGVDRYTSFSSDEEKERKIDTLVLMNKEGRIIELDREYVLSVEFLDKAIQTEINKALNKKYQRIKPDSAFLDLLISSEVTTEAQVQYTIPVAAWKMRYSIRQKDNGFTLDGAAIIDNNTDEDWDNFTISVVTGNPISFATDIADVIVPYRPMVHLLDDVSSADEKIQPCNSRNLTPRNILRGNLESSNVSNYVNFGMEDCEERGYEKSPAITPGVESKEVGDFCVFTSRETISVQANKSAIVPMFSVPLKSAGLVLIYQPEKNEKRMFRALKFKNETEYSLSKGKVLIYDDGVFSGECILENMKPGENKVLPHCLENGVKISKQTGVMSNKRKSIKISEGVVVSENSTSISTEYVIRNKKNEKFNIVLEHKNVIKNSELNITPEPKVKEDIDKGVRCYFELEPNQKLIVEIGERVVNSSRVELVFSDSQDWFFNLLNEKNGISITKDPKINDAIQQQTLIDQVNEDILNKESELEDLTEQVLRVRENIKAAKDASVAHKVAEWIQDLDETEKNIRKISKIELPELHGSVKKLREELTQILKDIVFEWED